MLTTGKNYGRKTYMGGGVLSKNTRYRIIRSVEKTFRQLSKRLIRESL
jgi:hypothetical protein